MKNIFSKKAAVKILLMALFASFSITGGFVDAERAQHGTLIKARGNVQYQKAGTTEWVRANERQRVSQGDKIGTGSDGEAIVRISERNFIAIKENSVITINTSTVRTEIDPNNKVLGLFPSRNQVQNVEIGHLAGRAVSVMKGLGQDAVYRVRTPAATAAVRGTTFVSSLTGFVANSVDFTFIKIEAPTPSKTVTIEFRCLDGRVDVSPNQPNTFEPQTLGEGASLSINFNQDGSISGTPPIITPAPSADLLNMAASFFDASASSSDFTSSPNSAANINTAVIQAEQNFIDFIHSSDFPYYSYYTCYY